MCPVNAELKVIDFKGYKQLGQEHGYSEGAPDSSEILFLLEMGLLGQARQILLKYSTFEGFFPILMNKAKTIFQVLYIAASALKS
jgi:hypothetical protein